MIKLQCINEAMAIIAHSNYRAETIRLGSALICIDVTNEELGSIQQQANAYTVELTDYDREQVEICLQG